MLYIYFLFFFTIKMNKKYIGIGILVVVVIIFVVYWMSLTSDPLSNFTFYNMQDSYGNDINSTRGITLAQAAAAANANSLCVGFVFVGTASSGTAYYKSAITTLTPLTVGGTGTGSGFYKKN